MGRFFRFVAVIAAAAAAYATTYLRGTVERPRAPAAQRELEAAVASVDRELAADLELTTMFDQTKQALVLENGQYLLASAAIGRHAPEVHGAVADLYERIPAVESAMERRGPAGSIAEADLTIVHDWEGDARELQRRLRAALRPPLVTRWQALRERSVTRPPGG